MAIIPVSAVNSEFKATVSNVKKTTNPITENKQSFADNKVSSTAIASYFKGGMAVSFGGHDCSTAHFVTKQMDDVPCCCCGGKMVLNKQRGEKAKEFGALRGQELADKIRNNQDYFRCNQRLIANLIADEAEKHPDYDMGDAIQSFTPETFKQKTLEYCVKNLKNIDKIAKQATGNESNPISTLVASEIEKVNGGKTERVEFTEKLAMYEGLVKPEEYEKILESAMNIPERYKDVKQIYDYAYGKALKVAKELIRPSMQTIEHIHPKSQGGPNNTENYIAECYNCNNPRGHMSYHEWLKVHPEYPINAQKHIEWFQQQIIDGKIDEQYDTYPIEVKATLSKESDGRMELKVLNPERIKELREARQAGAEIDIKEELTKEYGEETQEA